MKALVHARFDDAQLTRRFSPVCLGSIRFPSYVHTAVTSLTTDDNLVRTRSHSTSDAVDSWTRCRLADLGDGVWRQQRAA
jgi:hypothetical protein